jgi:hypothetical protein
MKGGTYPTLTTLNRSNGPYNLSSRPVISQSTLRDSNVTSNNNGKINNHNNNYNQTAVQNNMINNNINEYKITKSDLNTLKNEIIDKVRTELDDKLQNGMNTLLTKVFEMCDNIYKLNHQLIMNAILNETENAKKLLETLRQERRAQIDSIFTEMQTSESASARIAQSKHKPKETA